LDFRSLSVVIYTFNFGDYHLKTKAFKVNEIDCVNCGVASAYEYGYGCQYECGWQYEYEYI